MLGVSKAHITVGLVALGAYALAMLVQSPRGLNFKIPVVGPFLPGGQ